MKKAIPLGGRRFRLFACVLATVALVAEMPSLAAAQQKDLPSAKEIIEHYVEVTGGVDQYRSLKTMRAEGTISIPQAGISGTIEVVQELPDKISTTTVLGGLGETRQGTNGKVAWEVSTIMGARLLEGEEAEQLKDEADMARVLEPEKHFKEMRCTGVEDVDGEKCYVVELVKNNGRKQTEYYSVKRGLLVRSIVSAVTNMGDMQVETKMLEFRDVDGIKSPRKIEQKLPNGMTVSIVFDKIEYNVDLPNGAFEVPEEVRELMTDDSDASDADAGTDGDHETISLKLPNMT